MTRSLQAVEFHEIGVAAVCVVLPVVCIDKLADAASAVVCMTQTASVTATQAHRPAQHEFDLHRHHPVKP